MEAPARVGRREYVQTRCGHEGLLPEGESAGPAAGCWDREACHAQTAIRLLFLRWQHLQTFLSGMLPAGAGTGRKAPLPSST